MEVLLKALEGPYLAVFLGMTGVITWLLKDRANAWLAVGKTAERLLEEREKRAQESLETARLLSESSQRLTDHTKSLEKVLDRWATTQSA